MFALAGERKAAYINWIQFYRTRRDAEDKSYNHREHLIPLKVKSEAVGRSVVCTREGRGGGGRPPTWPNC